MQRFSKTLCNTLKETPNDAVIASHQLMLRAGLIQKSGHIAEDSLTDQLGNESRVRRAPS